MVKELAYELETKKPFAAVVESVITRVPEHKFRVLAVHDVQQTLAEKGLERDPLKIIEVCNAGFAHQALSQDPMAALFMPCRFTIQVEGGKTIVRLARPTMIADMLPEAGLDELASDVEKTLKRIMHESVQ